jgi:hypothetical protein
MAFDLDFSMCIASDCNQMQLCDTTGDFNPLKPAENCDGYGVIDYGLRTDEIMRSQVASTTFSFIMPSGATYTNQDLGFVPAQYAQVSFTLSGGAIDDWIVVLINGISLGNAIYYIDLSQTIIDLVNSINSYSDVTGWTAYYASSTITIRNTDSGTEFNGLTLTTMLNTSSNITVTTTSDQTAGGNDGDDCITITVPEVYGQGRCPDGLCCWPVGVYTLTYKIFDTNGVELARKQKKFLVDCQVSKCIYNHVKILTGDDCKCDTAKAWPKVLRLKQTLEAIQEEFACGLYDCANEHVQDLYDECKSMCLDC